jgi:hypothetical protein
MGEYKKLLVLCCHGVYHRGKFYAEYPKEREVYEEHIRESYNALKEGRYDVLIVSGGYTKYPVEKSEARGYLDWSDDLGLARTGLIILEEHARSSVENLLFSMCRYYQYFNNWPEAVGACTLGWKKEWFEQVITLALCLPNFYAISPKGEEEKLCQIGGRVGINPREIAEKNKNRQDPLEILETEKLQQRDFWKKGHSYADINDDFSRMFEKLKQMKRDRNTNVEILKPFYPWTQKN